MRCLLSFALDALLASNANAQAFGVAMGEPVTKYNGKNQDGITYDITVPQPNSEFEFYTADATPTTGICNVTGTGKPHNDDPSGISVQKAAKKLKTGLTAKFGNSKSFGLTLDEVIYDDPDLVWALKEDIASVHVAWHKKYGSQLPPGVKQVSLGILATDDKTARILLYYNFDNDDRCEALAGQTGGG